MTNQSPVEDDKSLQLGPFRVMFSTVRIVLVVATTQTRADPTRFILEVIHHLGIECLKQLRAKAFAGSRNSP